MRGRQASWAECELVVVHVATRDRRLLYWSILRKPTDNHDWSRHILIQYLKRSKLDETLSQDNGLASFLIHRLSSSEMRPSWREGLNQQVEQSCL